MGPGVLGRVLPYAAIVGLFAGIFFFVQQPPNPLVPWLLAAVSMMYLLFYGLDRTLSRGISAEASASRLLSIETSGPRLAYLRTDGRLGGVSFGGPLLGISVYRAGIVVRPLFFRARRVLTREIDDVRLERR